MTRHFGYHRTRVLGLTCGFLFANAAMAELIARFPDPLPDGGGATMFRFIQGSHGLYGGWAGPPGITLETPLGTFSDCTMRAYPMYVDSVGHVRGGRFTFYGADGAEIFLVTFSGGFVDSTGLICGPDTGGTVDFAFFSNGVQLPPGLTEPLTGSWFNFEFHNRVQGSRGPEWTASFTCGAVGVKGDLDCDGTVDFNDIDAFVLALTDQAAYQGQHPYCDWLNADINGDASVDFNDIDGFVTCVINNGCP